MRKPGENGKTNIATQRSVTSLSGAQIAWAWIWSDCVNEVDTNRLQVTGWWGPIPLPHLAAVDVTIATSGGFTQIQAVTGGAGYVNAPTPSYAPFGFDQVTMVASRLDPQVDFVSV